MIEIKAHTPQIGGGVTDQGDVFISAVDPNQGIAITIVIESAYWKKALENFGRIKGVGIVTGKPNLIPVKGIQDI